jgi:capsular polysaccharide biosynthesis protein
MVPQTSRRVSELSSSRFDKGGHSIPEWWQDDPVLPGRAVEMYRLSNAYYFPTTGAILSSNGGAMEAATEEIRLSTPDKSLAYLPCMAVSGETTTFHRPGNLPRLKRAIVTMPAGAIVNYGHFILDCLSGIVATMRVPELKGYPYIFPPLADWQRRHLQLLGITSPVIATENIYRVARVVFTNCMAHNLHAPNLHFRDIRDIQLSNVDAEVPSGVGERLYISRRGAHMRVFLDEPELENSLAASGFTVVQPELYPVDQQIQMFRRAKIIVGPTGAAFANVLYCQPGAHVIEIVPRQMAASWVGWLCTLTDARWRPYFCEGRSEREWAVQYDLEFGVDTADFMQHLRNSMTSL